MRVGIFFITNDDQIVIRKVRGHTARTNVWFEIGMFAARHGRENTIVLVEEGDLADNKIPSDYYGVNLATFKIPSGIKDAVKNAWGKKGALQKTKSAELRTALKRCFDTQIKPVLRQLVQNPTEFTDTIPDRPRCYEKAQEMINDAKEWIFTIVSYEQELDKPAHREGLLPALKRKIDKVRESGSSALNDFKVKRWMNLGAENIQRQAKQILNSRYAKYVEVRDTYCHFIEAVVTEDKVLLPLPKASHTWIGQGIYIESVQVANLFAEWFEKTLPEPNQILLTKENFDNYVRQASIRNAGHRSSRCYACSKSLPEKRWLYLSNQ